jgi:Flp pilus assembly protein TadG
MRERERTQSVGGSPVRHEPGTAQRGWLSAEDGGVAVFVAILLVVLVGFTTFVVDVGDGMWERRMLQNSADSAALAVAIDCAQGDCGSESQYRTLASAYADDNNWRGAEVVDVLGPSGAPLVTAAGGEVTVRVATQGTEDNPGTLRQWFSGVLGRETGLGTQASATVTWGALGSAKTLPLTISICEWYQATNGGTNLPTGTEYLAFKNAPGGSQCELSVEDYPGTLDPNEYPGGLDFPGGFGWLDLSSEAAADGQCASYVENGEVGGSVGNPGFPTGDNGGPGQGQGGGGGKVVCNQAYYQSLLGQTLLLPVHIDVNGQGQNAVYEVTGFAAFKLTGYKLGSGNNLTAPAGFSCPFGAGNNAVCLEGQFMETLVSGAIPSGGAVDFGAVAVALRD